MSKGRGGALSAGPDFFLARAARWLLFATLLVPIVVSPGFLFPFVTIRAVYFRILVEIVTAILLYLLLRRELTLHFRRDPVFWSLFAWVGVNALAAAFGAAPMRSIFGDHERMGGVWFWVHLLAYYVALRTFLREEDWWRFFRVAVAIAATVALYGLLRDRFNFFTFGIGGIQTGATIGNSGLLAIYLLANVALSAMLAARSRGRARLAYVVLSLLLVAGMFFSGNRSSTLALVLGSGLAFFGYLIWSRSVRALPVGVMLALFATAAALPFLARAHWAQPVTSRIPAISRLSGGVDSSRVVQWRAAVDGIRDRPLLGVGPENYQIVWSRFYHPEMYRFLADSRWDRAHNAYLDAFATSGIFGFLALLAIWIALAWTVTKSAKARRDEDAAGKGKMIEAIALGFFGAYAFYLFFWFFDLNSTMLWIALAAFVASRAAGAPLLQFGARREKRWQSTMVLAAGAVAFAAVLYVHGFETLRMAHTLNRVRSPARPMAESLRDYESVFGSPAPITQHAFIMYAGYLRSLYPDFARIRSNASDAALFDRAFVLAIEEFERQAVRDPLNERITVQHARVLMLGAYYYGNLRLYESALKRLQRAVELAPRRVPAHLVLGMAYLNVQRPREALKAFEQAYAIYPPLGQTHSYLAAAHAALGQNQAAAAWLQSALNNGYLPDQSLVRNIAMQLDEAGKTHEGAELLRLYLQKKIGPAFTWSPNGSPSAAGDHELASLAADLFLESGDPASAQALHGGAAVICSPAMPLVQPLYSGQASPGPVADCRQPWRLAPTGALLSSRHRGF